MRELPILFNGPMVQALLDGRKTQTRRVVKRPKWAAPDAEIELDADGWPCIIARKTGCLAGIPCPYGEPGDLLWVREAWCGVIDDRTGAVKWNPDGNTYQVEYRATNELGIEFLADDDGGVAWRKDGTARSPWKSPLFMPRWASRLERKNAGVRVERVQDISEADAEAEACEPVSFRWSRESDAELEDLYPLLDRERPWASGFSSLWDSINAERGFPWSANSLVWAVDLAEFTSTEVG